MLEDTGFLYTVLCSAFSGVRWLVLDFVTELVLPLKWVD